MNKYLQEGFDKFGSKVPFKVPDVEIDKPYSWRMEEKIKNFPESINELQKIQMEGLASREEKLSKVPQTSKLKDMWYSSKLVKFFFGRGLAMKPADRVIALYDNLRQNGVNAKDATFIATTEVYQEKKGFEALPTWKGKTSELLTDKQRKEYGEFKQRMGVQADMDMLMFTPAGTLKKTGMGIIEKPVKIVIDNAIKAVVKETGVKTSGATMRFIEKEAVKSVSVPVKVISKVKGEPVKEVSKKIISQVHILKKKLNLSDDAYKILAKKATGETSVKSMTTQQADNFVKVMSDKITKSKVGEKIGPLEKYVYPYNRTLQKIGAGKFSDRISDAYTVLHKDKDNYTALYKTIFKGVKRNSEVDQVSGQLLRNFTSVDDILKIF